MPKLFKRKIDAATVNVVQSELIQLSSKDGYGFRFQDMWIAIPDLDAIVAGDDVQFQISTESQAGNAALYEINSEKEVFTWSVEHIDYGTAGVAIKESIRKSLYVPEIDGVMLDLSLQYYLNVLITGQDGAVPVYLKFQGNPVDQGYDDYHYHVI